MNTLDKLVGSSGCSLVTGATKVVFPTGYAAYAIVVGADATEVTEVEQMVSGAPVVLDDASWQNAALTRSDIITLENPIISITLNAAGSVWCYFQPCDYVEPPTSFSATIDSGVAIDLAWTNNTNADGIVTERSLDEVTWVIAATIAKDPTPVVTFKDEDLEEETKYYYRARAFHGNNYSAYTATDDATTLTV